MRLRIVAERQFTQIRYFTRALARMEIREIKKIGWLYGVMVLFSIGAAYTISVATGYLNLPFACISDERATIPDISGMRFDVTYTNCDVIAKQEAISVYVSPTERAVPLLNEFFSRRSLLFRYDPDSFDSPLPEIKVLHGDAIVISVPKVSSIDYERRAWRRLSINYDVGHVDYP